MRRTTTHHHRAVLRVVMPALRCGVLVVAAGLAAAGCGSSEMPGGTAAPAQPGFPLTITNCGQELRFEAPPKRAVTMDQVATEVLLGLELADSMAGTALLFNPPVYPTFADDYARVPVLAKGFPSKETLVNASPDMVIGNLEYFTYNGFSPGSNFSRQELTDRGINSFTLRCQGESLTEVQLYERYRELGRIFGVTPRAEAFVQSVQAGLATTTAKLEGVEPVRTFTIAGVGGQGTLVTRGGDVRGIGLAGGTNLFPDLPELVGGGPPTVSVEQVVSRNPQAIVIDDAGSTDPDAPSPQEQQALLRDRLSTTAAVQNNRFCISKRLDFEGGRRTVDAVEKLAQCLHPEVAF